MLRPRTFFAAAAVALFALAPASARAQSVTVFASGLEAPTKIVATGKGNLLVAEGGHGANTGRISIVDPTGVRRTLVDGLPSAFNLTAEGSPSGPSGIAIRGNTVYVSIADGDVLIPGPQPGTLVPNPAPTSQLFSSILVFRFGAPVDGLDRSYTLSEPDRQALADGGDVALRSGERGNTARVSVLANFPDFVADPLPDFPDNVRSSNPFGVALSGDTLYVVDASFNSVRSVGVATGAVGTLVTFAQLANPLPVGPPSIDTVPDGIAVFGDSLLVTWLTGFPFPPGVAEVRRVNRTTGADAPFVEGLTSAIDVLPVGDDTLYALEFSVDILSLALGRLLVFSAQGDGTVGEPTVLADTLVTPVGVARNPKTGELFATEISTGRIVRVRPD